MAKYKNDSLGDRMKTYERRNQYYLQIRTPVVIRVDMKAGHSFTRGLIKPFDNVFTNSMIQMMEAVCKEIQGCYFTYVQSDECSFAIQDYKNFNTSPWFEYRTDKLCSIAASLATWYFNKFFRENAQRIINLNPTSDYALILEHCLQKLAVFDARCFSLPRDELTNYFYWRQLDAVRNSIQACGQAEFSHKELMYKTCDNIKQMLNDIGKSWDNLPIYKQRGTCCRREGREWITDYSMPLLVKEGREYLETLI